MKLLASLVSSSTDQISTCMHCNIGVCSEVSSAEASIPVPWHAALLQGSPVDDQLARRTPHPIYDIVRKPKNTRHRFRQRLCLGLAGLQRIHLLSKAFMAIVTEMMMKIIPWHKADGQLRSCPPPALHGLPTVSISASPRATERPRTSMNSQQRVMGIDTKL